MVNDPWAKLPQEPLPPAVRAGDVTEREGVVYSSIPGYRPLELDVYAPADARGALPAIVWIHGGAFALGSRRIAPAFLAEVDFFRRTAREGFVVVSVDYRLSGEAPWPAQLMDVRAAVRWLTEHAAELSIDPRAIVAWGESAGGHLAAMAGILGDRERPEEVPGLTLPRVAAVIDWYGPTDFRQMDVQAGAESDMRHDAADSPESRLLRSPVQEAGMVADDANPAHHVTAGSPPFLIHHGRDDRLVPFGQSDLLASRLRSVGADVTLVPVGGAGHVFEGHPDPASFVEEAIAFLRRVLPAPEGSGGLAADTTKGNE